MSMFCLEQIKGESWLAGFCRNMRVENKLYIRQNMLDYLISLLDDAYDLSSNRTMISNMTGAIA